jgi:uncharacterized FlaG/YvyC family protein
MSISSINSGTVTFSSGNSGWSETQVFAAPASNVPKFDTTQPEASAATVTQAASPARVEQAVTQVNEAFTQKGQNLYAAIERDKSTGIDVVKVLDKHTNEVISQFPSKTILAIAESIEQFQEDKGQLLNVSA